MSKHVLPMFSSKSFMVSGLIFRYLIHFEFTFMYGVKKFSNFFILSVAVQYSQDYLLKRFFSPLSIFAPFTKDKVPLGAWALYLLLLVYVSVSVPVPQCSDYCSCVVYPEVRKVDFLQLHLSFSRLLWLFRIFCVSIQIVKHFVLVL